MSWVGAFSLTLLLEGVVLTICLRPRSYPWLAILGLTLVLNTVTHPLVWFAFPPGWGGWIGSELFAWLSEAALLFGYGRLRRGRERVPPVDALLVSFAANGVTAAVGLLL